MPFTALPYGAKEEHQALKTELVNLTKEEDFVDKIVACLYVDQKAVKELEEKMLAGNAEAERNFNKIIMSAPCASILQMYFF